MWVYYVPEIILSDEYGENDWRDEDSWNPRTATAATRAIAMSIVILKDCNSDTTLVNMDAYAKSARNKVFWKRYGEGVTAVVMVRFRNYRNSEETLPS